MSCQDRLRERRAGIINRRSLASGWSSLIQIAAHVFVHLTSRIARCSGQIDRELSQKLITPAQVISIGDDSRLRPARNRSRGEQARAPVYASRRSSRRCWRSTRVSPTRESYRVQPPLRASTPSHGRAALAGVARAGAKNRSEMFRACRNDDHCERFVTKVGRPI
jgi:hypothetical protein